MTVLFLDQYNQMGGAQRGLVDTIDAALERGWNAQVVLPGFGPLAEQLRSRGVAVSAIPCGPYRSSRKSSIDFLRFAFDLREQIQTIRDLGSRTTFDLLYVNGPRLMPAAALARNRSTPVLFHAHSHIRQAAVARLAGWSIRRADATVVACSDSVLAPLRAYAKKNSFVLPNGVREVLFRERRFDTLGSWRIGMIARVTPEKGQAEFLKAAALIAREFPNARFVICGAPLFGDSIYGDGVKSLATGLPVEFLGWREDVNSVFAELDLLIAPSKQEGMGRVLVEAFSAGVPVVAFPIGGIPEVVLDGETGFLTQANSPEALAARIREVILSGSEVLRRVVLNARRAWERTYALEHYQQRITEIMERVVSVSKAERETETPQTRR